MIAAKKIQAKNVSEEKAAKADTKLKNDKAAILGDWVTAGKNAISGTDASIVNQKAWHARSIKAATTDAELDTLKKADTASHKAAVSA